MVGLAAQGAEWTRGTDDEVRSALSAELRRFDEADAFGVLALPYDVDDKVVRTTFLSATKILHPHRFARRDPATRRMANEVFLMIMGAYDAIQSEDGRNRVLGRIGKGTEPATTVASDDDAPEATPTSTRAKERQASAEARRRASRRRQANRRKRTVSPADLRKRGTTTILETTADDRYETAKKQVRAGQLREAREVFRALAVSHTTDRRYRSWMHYTMGRIHQYERNDERARIEYRRSLESDSNFQPALKALDEMNTEQPSSKKGLFSKLFKK